MRAGNGRAGGFPPGDGHTSREIERSTALFLIVDSSAPVGPPNLPLRLTRPRALRGREIVRAERAEPRSRTGD